MAGKLIQTAAVLALLGFVSACGPGEEILPGERLDLRADLDALAEDGSDPNAAAAPENRSLPVSLGAARANGEWTHRNGGPEHRIDHPALSAAPQRIWSASIGQGAGRRNPFMADPVVAGGRIFTVDSRATLAATNPGGAVLWRRDLTPASDRADDVSGGGLAYANGRLYVTTGFGDLHAVDPETGADLWTQKFDAAAAGAPTVYDGIVYVAARDGSAWAVDAGNGRVKWQMQATPSASGMTNGSAPAIAGQTVIFPFASGELVAVLRKSGMQVWKTVVAGRKLGRAYGLLSDITADPVVLGDTVYVGNQSGRTEALDAATGEAIWSAKEGAYSAVWPAGGSVFLISDDARLVRLDAATGEAIWSVELPYYLKAKPRKLKSVYGHYGPVLAGGRLIVMSSDGLMRSFDPASGALLATVDIPGGAASNAAVAGGVLYVVSQNGQLHAFR